MSSADPRADDGARPWLGACLAGFLALGVWLRLRGAGSALLYGDEYHGLEALALPWSAILARFDAVGTHAVLPLLQRAAVEAFGSSPASLRLPALVPGLAALLLCYPVARGFVGRVPAAIATMALAVSPVHVFYSHFARSYALALLLGLVLAGFARRAVEAPRARPLPVLGAVATAALLPWTHLSSAGLVAGLGLAACGRRLATRGPRAALAPAGLGLVAALLCAALFWPARADLGAYLDRVAGQGEWVAPLEVAALLFGGALPGAVCGLALALALLALALRRDAAAPWLLGAVLVPVAVLVVQRPYGMAYAWSRYLLVALPFAWMALAWGLHGLARRCVAAPRAADAASLAGSAALLLALFANGPLGPRAPADAPFQNAYLALMRLPAFDVPAPRTPGVYAELAADARVARIVEAPSLRTRSVLLYRNYRLQHGKDVVLGSLPGDEVPVEGPYVRLDAAGLARSGADVLVVHRDPRVELTRYWQFVYEQAWPTLRRPADRGPMERHKNLVLAPHVPDPGQLARLRMQLGPPHWEDADVLAWRLRARP